MPLQVAFRPQAAAEALEVQEWYETRSPGLGDQFGEALEELVERIANLPAAFPRVHGATQRAVLRRFPYAVYFRVASGSVVVLSIHGRRDPEAPRLKRSTLDQQLTMLRFASVILCCSIGAGCAVDDPEVDELLNCIRDSAEVVTHTGNATTAECVVPEEWTLVALPAGSASKSELTRLGVPEGLASMVAHDADDKADWCVARELPIQPVPEGTQRTSAKSTCVAWLPAVDQPVVAPAGAVRIMFTKSESGQTKVTNIDPVK